MLKPRSEDYDPDPDDGITDFQTFLKQKEIIVDNGPNSALRVYKKDLSKPSPKGE